MTPAGESTGRIRAGSFPSNDSPAARPGFRGLSLALAILSLAGCARQPTAPRRAFADLGQLCRAHPAVTQLAAWDGQLAAAQREAGPVLLAAGYLELDLAPLEPLPSLPALDTTESERRLAEQIRDDGTRSEQILVEEADTSYLDDLIRLRSELRATREQEPEPDLAAYEASVREAGKEIAALEAQMHALRPNPTGDRFFYTPEQIRHRQAMYEQLRRDVDALREKRIAELALRLAPRPEGSRQLPESELLALRQRRGERLARAIADLHQGEAEAAQRVAAVPPWPATPAVGALALAPDGTGGARFAENLERTANDSVRQDETRARDLALALAKARRQRGRLEAAVRSEVASLARNMARDWGYELHLDAPQGRDLTRRLAPRLAEYFRRLPSGGSLTPPDESQPPARR